MESIIQRLHNLKSKIQRRILSLRVERLNKLLGVLVYCFQSLNFTAFE